MIYIQIKFAISLIFLAALNASAGDIGVYSKGKCPVDASHNDKESFIPLGNRGLVIEGLDLKLKMFFGRKSISNYIFAEVGSEDFILVNVHNPGFFLSEGFLDELKSIPLGYIEEKNSDLGPFGVGKNLVYEIGDSGKSLLIEVDKKLKLVLWGDFNGNTVEIDFPMSMECSSIRVVDQSSSTSAFSMQDIYSSFNHHFVALTSGLAIDDVGNITGKSFLRTKTKTNRESHENNRDRHN